jgi:hypothetical protein
LRLAAELEGTSGKYLEGKTDIESSKTSYSVEKQKDLWNWTLRFVARDVAELKKFETNNSKFS